MACRVSKVPILEKGSMHTVYMVLLEGLLRPDSLTLTGLLAEAGNLASESARARRMNDRFLQTHISHNGTSESRPTIERVNLDLARLPCCFSNVVPVAEVNNLLYE